MSSVNVQCDPIYDYRIGQEVDGQPNHVMRLTGHGVGHGTGGYYRVFTDVGSATDWVRESPGRTLWWMAYRSPTDYQLVQRVR